MDSNIVSQTPDVKNVLFVDDEASVVNSLRLLFRRVKSLRVYTTTNQQEALKLIESVRMHVVVSDMKMPNMNGAELLSEVKKRSPNTLRILLTGYSEMNNIIKSINKGEVYRFLEKPWVNRDLKKKVLQAVDISEKLWQKENTWLIASKTEQPSDNKQTSSLANATLRLQTDTLVPIEQETHTKIESAPDQAILFIGHPESEVYTLLKRHFETPIYHASNAQKAVVKMLKHQEITTIVAHADAQYRIINRYSHFADIASLLKTLKSIFPMLVSIVATDEHDSRIAIGLVNEAQVFRYMSPPLFSEQILQDTRDALQYAQILKIDPLLAKQHTVEEMAEIEKQHFMQHVDFSLFDRLRKRFQSFLSHFSFKSEVSNIKPNTS